MKMSQKFALLRSVSGLSLAPSSQDANYDLASCKAFELEEWLLNHDYGCNESSHMDAYIVCTRGGKRVANWYQNFHLVFVWIADS